MSEDFSSLISEDKGLSPLISEEAAQKKILTNKWGNPSQN